MHAVGCLNSTQLDEAQAGYKYFGFGEIAELIGKAKIILDAADDTDEQELAFDNAYWKQIPDDAVLVARFEKQFALDRFEFAPIR